MEKHGQTWTAIIQVIHLLPLGWPCAWPILERVLAESRAAAEKARPGEEIEAAFEQEVNPKIEYDLELRDAPFLDSLLTLTSVTTFLAGFVAADFSGFSLDDWTDQHWAFAVLYIFFLAFAEGCCVYLSICGTIAGATYQRTKNQLNACSWREPLRAALGPISRNIHLLRGKRMDTYRAAVTTFIHGEADFFNAHFYSGDSSPKAEFILTRVESDQESEARWVLTVVDPAFIFGSRYGYKYVTSAMFPIAIVFYLGAQTLKALRGAAPSLLAAVLIPILFWSLGMARDLRLLYSKLRD